MIENSEVQFRDTIVRLSCRNISAQNEPENFSHLRSPNHVFVHENVDIVDICERCIETVVVFGFLFTVVMVFADNFVVYVFFNIVTPEFS